ncbi:LPS export ABC transporter periplasmic protein LptC [Vampirovibrio sp.]|uniref:LPS export ABC transporter periplasmic protein LptC n=1 Tax=Vampirovibrio sp. TaxID=2717857 RepID=UPI0035934007
MNSYRKLILLALIILLIGGGWSIWNADQNLKREEAIRKQQQQAAQKNPTMTGKNASFTVTEGNVKKWKLDAATATYSEDNSEALLNDVKGEFYNAEGKPVLAFSAPHGKYLTNNNQVTLSGGVIAASKQKPETGGKGGTLKAPTMSWNAKTELVTATGGVEMTFPEGKSTAQTCRFTLDFSNISLEGGVTSSLSAI